MYLETALRQYNGVLPTRVLRDAGYSYARLQQLCAEKRLVRVRRGWLAAPRAAPELVLAAQNAGVLTCVTQARRLGLWTTAPDRAVHLGLDHGAKRPAVRGLRLHWHAPIMPRDPYLVEDPLINVLAMVARCLAFEDALAVWDSAINKKLIQLTELQRFPLSGVARQLVREVTPYSDSGLESFVKLRLKRFRLKICAQAWLLGHCVDLLIGERLVVQIDGGTHVGEQRSRDIEHDALLTLNGFHVIRVSYEHVMARWPEVQDLILQAVAQGLHLAQRR